MNVLSEEIQSQITGGTAGGNLIVPVLCSLGIGVTGGLLSWTIKTSYEGKTEEFNSITNYVLEGSVGALIATFATAGFVMAA